MIRHVVLFGFQEYDGKSAKENAETAKELLLGLADKIDLLRRIEVGVNADNADEKNETLCLICDFDTLEDLNSYAVHPEHLKVCEFIKNVKKTRTCVDYEI